MKRRSWWVQGWAVAAAAAAVAVVVLAVSVANLQGDVTHLQNQAIGGALPSAVANALSSPGHQVVQLRTRQVSTSLAPSSRRAGTRSWFRQHCTASGSSQTYQLWAESRGKPVSLGVLGPSPGISLFRVESGMTALMLTAEPSGGVPAPTSAVLAAGGVPTSDLRCSSRSPRMGGDEKRPASHHSFAPVPRRRPHSPLAIRLGPPTRDERQPEDRPPRLAFQLRDVEHSPAATTLSDARSER